MPDRVVRGRRAQLAALWGLAAVVGAGFAYHWMQAPRAPEARAKERAKGASPNAQPRPNRSALARVLHGLGEASAAGTVLDDLGAPVPNARVCASIPFELTAAVEAQQCALTDRDGYYQLTPLAEGDAQVSLTVAAANYATQTATFTPATQPLNAWGELLVDFTLSPAEPNVLGEVLDATGDVVPGARLRVMAAGLNVPATSDASGLFTLHLPEGQHNLMVDAPGFAGSMRTVVAPSQHITLTLLPESELAGQILTPNGEPGKDVRIIALPSPLSSDQPSTPLASTKTDDAGRFSLHHLTNGNYYLLAQADSLLGTATIALGHSASPDPLTLMLQESSALRGTLDSALTPQTPCGPALLALLPRAKAEGGADDPASSFLRQAPLEGDSSATAPASLPWFARFDARGAFEFPAVPPGAHTLQLLCPGTPGRVTLEAALKLEAGEAKTIESLSLPPMRGMTLTAVDASEQAVPGIGLRVEPFSPSRRATSEAPTESVAAELQRPAHHASALKPIVLHTNQQGQAHWLGAQAGRYRVTAIAPHIVKPQVLAIGANELWPNVALKVTGSAAITVEVIDEFEGLPQDGVNLSVRREEQGASASAALARTATSEPRAEDAALALRPMGLGRYQVDHLPSGRYELSLVDRCNPQTTDGSHRAVELRPGQHTLLTLEAHRDGLLQGMVVDPDGAPLANTWVIAHAADRRPVAESATAERAPAIPTALANTIDPGTCFALTDSDGQFVITGVSSRGRFNLYAMQREASDTSFLAGSEHAAKSDQPLVITAREHARLVGRAVSGDGTPAALSSANARSEDSHILHAGRVLDDGGFAFDRLPIGRIHLELRETSGARLSTLVTLPDLAPEPLELRFPPVTPTVQGAPLQRAPTPGEQAPPKSHM